MATRDTDPVGTGVGAKRRRSSDDGDGVDNASDLGLGLNFDTDKRHDLKLPLPTYQYSLKSPLSPRGQRHFSSPKSPTALKSHTALREVTRSPRGCRPLFRSPRTLPPSLRYRDVTPLSSDETDTDASDVELGTSLEDVLETDAELEAEAEAEAERGAMAAGQGAAFGSAGIESDDDVDAELTLPRRDRKGKGVDPREYGKLHVPRHDSGRKREPRGPKKSLARKRARRLPSSAHPQRRIVSNESMRTIVRRMDVMATSSTDEGEDELLVSSLLEDTTEREDRASPLPRSPSLSPVPLSPSPSDGNEPPSSPSPLAAKSRAAARRRRHKDREHLADSFRQSRTRRWALSHDWDADDSSADSGEGSAAMDSPRTFRLLESLASRAGFKLVPKSPKTSASPAASPMHLDKDLEVEVDSPNNDATVQHLALSDLSFDFPSPIVEVPFGEPQYIKDESQDSYLYQHSSSPAPSPPDHIQTEVSAKHYLTSDNEEPQHHKRVRMDDSVETAVDDSVAAKNVHRLSSEDEVAPSKRARIASPVVASDNAPLMEAREAQVSAAATDTGVEIDHVAEDAPNKRVRLSGDEPAASSTSAPPLSSVIARRRYAPLVPRARAHGRTPLAPQRVRTADTASLQRRSPTSLLPLRRKVIPRLARRPIVLHRRPTSQSPFGWVAYVDETALPLTGVAYLAALDKRATIQRRRRALLARFRQRTQEERTKPAREHRRRVSYSDDEAVDALLRTDVEMADSEAVDAVDAVLATPPASNAHERQRSGSKKRASPFPARDERALRRSSLRASELMVAYADLRTQRASAVAARSTAREARRSEERALVAAILKRAVGQVMEQCPNNQTHYEDVAPPTDEAPPQPEASTSASGSTATSRRTAARRRHERARLDAIVRTRRHQVPDRRTRATTAPPEEVGSRRYRAFSIEPVRMPLSDAAHAQGRVEVEDDVEVEVEVAGAAAEAEAEVEAEIGSELQPAPAEMEVEAALPPRAPLVPELEDEPAPPAYEFPFYPVVRAAPPPHLRAPRSPRSPPPTDAPLSPPAYLPNRYSRRSPSPPPPYNALTDRDTVVAPVFQRDRDEVEEVIPVVAPVARRPLRMYAFNDLPQDDQHEGEHHHHVHHDQHQVQHEDGPDQHDYAMSDDEADADAEIPQDGALGRIARWFGLW